MRNLALSPPLISSVIKVCIIGFVATNLSLIPPANAFNNAEAKAIGTFLKGAKWLRWTEKLPDTKIVDLAKTSEKSGGTKEVNKILGQMNLPNEVLEDTFARILVVQGRVKRVEVDGWMHRLSGVPGFRSAMSKSMGASPAKTAGHINEIRIADNAAQANYKVRGIGVPFNDPNKKSPTDIDVILEKNGRQIAIEAKDYLSNTPIPLDSFRADMLSLAEYRRSNPKSNVLPVFLITNKPGDPQTWKLLEAAARRHKVELLVGKPVDAIHQIPLLVP